ncbi:MAG TPA: hypothetical protein VK106_03905, partial [Balneolaceae bacterium]|nr:hypothetical protein [Balneolaceae bacterium]
EDKNEAIDGWEREQKEIYEKLNIKIGHKDELRELLKRLDEFQEARRIFRRAKDRLAEKKIAMQGHSKYGDEEPTIENIKLDEAQGRLEKFERSAEKREGINEAITTIETNIKNAKGGNSLENALKNRDEALLNLKNQYDENLSAAAGRLVVDQLKEELREQNRPKVFKKADKLFHRITKGRYNVRIDEQNEPEFIAYDNVEKMGKKLDQLSTGTRIQLLLSVRLAFVETQESTVKLPILADELLANSDDVRANAIIEALTEISRDGRQIFYFTAQADEVGKWQASLQNANDVDFKIYELNGQAQTNEINFQVHPAEPLRLMSEIPRPDGASHKEYRNKIDVKTYNLMLHKPSELHLWYLIEELNLLHQCLTKGINRWGQFASFLKMDGKFEGFERSALVALEEKIKLLKHYQSLFQQGRPKMIDRSILENSGAVSSHFIDEVCEKLDGLNGNPNLLLKALQNGEVSGFRANKIDQLESYLLACGFIDESKKLSLQEIKSEIQAFISNLEITAEEADVFLNRIIRENE